MERRWFFMPWRTEEGEVRARCYPSGKSVALRIAGIALILAGALLLLFCVPCWAWLAAIGATLIVLGVLLLRK